MRHPEKFSIQKHPFSLYLSRFFVSISVERRRVEFAYCFILFVSLCLCRFEIAIRLWMMDGFLGGVRWDAFLLWLYNYVFFFPSLFFTRFVLCIAVKIVVS
jgi:hypothetical protein